MDLTMMEELHRLRREAEAPWMKWARETGRKCRFKASEYVPDEATFYLIDPIRFGANGAFKGIGLDPYTYIIAHPRAIERLREQYASLGQQKSAHFLVPMSADFENDLATYIAWKEVRGSNDTEQVDPL